jgi:hypothetical protein
VDVLLAVLPTLIIFSTLIGLFIWLGRNRRNTWGKARGQEPGPQGPGRSRLDLDARRRRRTNGLGR